MPTTVAPANFYGSRCPQATSSSTRTLGAAIKTSYARNVPAAVAAGDVLTVTVLVLRGLPAAMGRAATARNRAPAGADIAYVQGKESGA